MSTKYVPVRNSAKAIKNFINESVDGDTIVCRTDLQGRLARRVITQVCPDKKITVMVKEQQK